MWTLPDGIGFYPASDTAFLSTLFGVKGKWTDETDKEMLACKLKGKDLEEWNTVLKDQKNAKIEYGSSKGTCCKDAKKEDVVKCIRAFAQAHSDSTYRVPNLTCRARAEEALSACCLKKGGKIDTKIGSVSYEYSD